jgi:pimeloyl-ACP methyl ester carboxylesterase
MVHVPSLFLAGGASDYITAEDHMMIQMQFPQSEIIEMMGAGHWLHAEQPDEFYQLVTDFLSF